MRPGRDVATLTGCARALGTLPSTPAAAVAIPTLPRNLRRLWETFCESVDVAGEPAEDTPRPCTAWGVLFILRRSFVDPPIDRNFCDCPARCYARSLPPASRQTEIGADTARWRPTPPDPVLLPLVAT